VKTVTSEAGKAMMGMAVACPPLEGIDLSGARGVLVLIAASKGTFKLAESPSHTKTASWPPEQIAGRSPERGYAQVGTNWQAALRAVEALRMA
jgi:hypothetical protein